MEKTNKIEYYRKIKRWTQARLAKEADVDQGNISKYEHGIGNPTIEILQRISNVLGVGIGELYGQQSAPAAETIPESHRRILRLLHENKLDSIEIVERMIQDYNYHYRKEPAKTDAPINVGRSEQYDANDFKKPIKTITPKLKIPYDK